MKKLLTSTLRVAHDILLVGKNYILCFIVISRSFLWLVEFIIHNPS